MPSPASPDSPLLVAGQNCWRIADCDRLAFLVDGQAYFDAIVSAFRKAERRIVIVGWDFDSRIPLRPQAEGAARCVLGDFLRGLVEARPELEICTLIWWGSLFYGSNADVPLSFGTSWWEHPRIRSRLDDYHPIGACLHDKIVCIDDKIAFLGGMDLTQGRWDTNDHTADDPRRTNAAGEPYVPVHDIQAVIDGDAAAAVAEFVAARWRRLTAEDLEPITTSGDPWPDNVKPVIRGHRVSFARTQPAYEDQEEIREVESLNLAFLGAAERFIYLETQYFAAPQVTEVLIKHLERPDGPEIVIVATLESTGWVEDMVMSENRDRQFAALRQADRYGRLRTFFLANRVDPLCEIKVHSKLAIVDDRILRVGSSNFNSRSLGYDSEFDLVIEAETPAARRAIAELRNRLFAEHMAVTVHRVAAAIRRRGSLIGAIEALNTHPRRLVSFPAQPVPETIELATGSAIVDPPKTIDMQYLWEVITSSSPPNGGGS